MPFKKPQKLNKDLLLWVTLLVPYLLLIPAAIWYFNKIDNIENSSFIIINKAEMTLSLYNYKGEEQQKSKIATGKNYGNKKTVGDLKTPEGIFKITSIENSSGWAHDFKDDTLGVVQNAYGPYFIRLHVPGQKGIGIHGTHDNNSLGSRASEGCIRMNNENLVELVKSVHSVSVVIITPGLGDIKFDSLDTLNRKVNKGRGKVQPTAIVIQGSGKSVNLTKPI